MRMLRLDRRRSVRRVRTRRGDTDSSPDGVFSTPDQEALRGLRRHRCSAAMRARTTGRIGVAIHARRAARGAPRVIAASAAGKVSAWYAHAATASESHTARRIPTPSTTSRRRHRSSANACGIRPESAEISASDAVARARCRWQPLRAASSATRSRSSAAPRDRPRPAGRRPRRGPTSKRRLGSCSVAVAAATDECGQRPSRRRRCRRRRADSQASSRSTNARNTRCVPRARPRAGQIAAREPGALGRSRVAGVELDRGRGQIVERTRMRSSPASRPCLRAGPRSPRRPTVRGRARSRSAPSSPAAACVERPVGVTDALGTRSTARVSAAIAPSGSSWSNSAWSNSRIGWWC